VSLRNAILDLVELRRTNRLRFEYGETYDNGHVGGPYWWQMAYHNAGATKNQRLLLAGNRVGKTRTGAAEIAIHATGDYPAWWQGVRFDHPVDVWVCGPRNEDVRDVVQNALFGECRQVKGKAELSGEGWVPKSRIEHATFRTTGVSGVLDFVDIKHRNGGLSRVGCKSYQQRAIAFQGTAKHLVWMDEEPEDQDIFGEILARLVSTDGHLIGTRTPLMGYTTFIKHFTEDAPGRFVMKVGWDDAPHISDRAKETFLAAFPEHERDARVRGDVLLGKGAVYNILPSLYTCDPFPIPDHWRRIVGIDFGIDHPFSAIWLAWDQEHDKVFVTDEFKASDSSAALHVQRINQTGSWIPVAWPHDGRNRDKGNGEQLIEQYRTYGLNALHRSARYDEETGGSQSRWRMTNEIKERMRNGRFQIFSTCHELLRELQAIHHDGTQIKAVNDDCESAMRYATMDLRMSLPFAERPDAAARPTRQNKAVEYDPHELLRS
jgi:phage terminase large subunit-like protein